MIGQPEYSFGDNWASYSKTLNEIKLAHAKESLEELLGDGWLTGKSMLDIGCGSGLFSIAGSMLGAEPVVGLDVDPISVHVSSDNAGTWLGDGARISFRHASVLDEESMHKMPKFDLVYAWGSLHHTGSMHQALELASQRVKPGGKLVVAIYNRHFTSPMWSAVKWLYNKLGSFGQRFLIWVFVPIILLAKWAATMKNPLRMRRGMDFMHNVEDWVGGYPYEYASVEEMTERLEHLGLVVDKIIAASVPTGCNEFVCSAPNAGSPPPSS